MHIVTKHRLISEAIGLIFPPQDSTHSSWQETRRNFHKPYSSETGWHSGLFTALFHAIAHTSTQWRYDYQGLHQQMFEKNTQYIINDDKSLLSTSIINLHWSLFIKVCIQH